MAVAFGNVVNITPETPAGTTTTASPSITTPATDPVVKVSIGLNSTTATVSSLNITGFGGTASEAKNLRSADPDATAYSSVWVIKSPTPNTAGTVAAVLSASGIPVQLTVETFSGADPTDPMPTGDIVTSITNVPSEVLTPLSLTANDLASGAAASTTGGNPGGINPNPRFTDTSTSVNFQVGDNNGGTGSLTFTWDSGGNPRAKIAVRIKTKEAAAGFPFYANRFSSKYTGPMVMRFNCRVPTQKPFFTAAVVGATVPRLYMTMGVGT